MSSFEKAMKRYFSASNESDNADTLATSSPSESDLEVDSLTVDTHSAETEIGVSESTDLQIPTSPSVALDLPRLKKEKIVLFSPSSRKAVDEYRNIKRPLLKQAFGDQNTVVDKYNLVLITSAVKGEGKTTTAINLALSIAKELDKTVLLIDADASQRGISHIMGIEERKGLTELLSGSVNNLSEVLVKTDVPKLTLLPAGQEDLHFTELLTSGNMRQLTDELSTRYSDRLILFDSSPLLTTTEARVLASLLGQILLVVEARKTTKSILTEAISYLDNTKPIGVVLNKNRQRFGKKHYHSYGYTNNEELG